MTTIDELAEYMRRRDLLLVTAESCTAGLIAARLADVPGAGDLLDCVFVTYSPQAKQRSLGVPESVLREHNLTSEPVARAMVEGAMRASRANVGIADTGMASADDPEIPPGTQCLAWAFRHGEDVRVHSETRRFPGDRQAVRRATAEYALLRIPFYYEQGGA